MKKFFVSLTVSIIAVSILCVPSVFADPLISPTEPDMISDISNADIPLSNKPDILIEAADPNAPSANVPNEAEEATVNSQTPLSETPALAISDYVTSPQTGVYSMNEVGILMIAALAFAVSGVLLIVIARKKAEISR